MPTVIEINDRADPRIADYLDIREHDVVGRQGRFVAEGEVVLRVLLGTEAYRPVSLLLAEKRAAALEAEIAALADSTPVYVAPQSIMDDIAGFPIHRGILALGARREELAAEAELSALKPRALVLALLGIANHDNMGGLMRNAAAFGVDLVILDSDCCDPLYRKAIRVSAGNVLRVPFARLERGVDAVGLLLRHGLTPVALSPRGRTKLAETSRPDRLALLFGAEGPGLPDDVLERVDTIRVPIAAGVDSLNVATASGIALHHFARSEPS